MMIKTLVALIFSVATGRTYAWVPLRSSFHRLAPMARHTPCLDLVPSNFHLTEFIPSSSSSASSVILSSDAPSSWRQYVPLVVSLLVITDILLGSPVANSIISPLRGLSEELNSSSPELRSRERVNSQAIAQEALDQARTSMELRDYLETHKTAEQRMQEIRDSMDGEMKRIDKTLEEHQKKLDAGQY